MTRILILLASLFLVGCPQQSYRAYPYESTYSSTTRIIWCADLKGGTTFSTSARDCGDRGYFKKFGTRESAERYLASIESSATPTPIPTPTPTPAPTPTPKPENRLVGTGTGFAVDKNYVVTAEHVLDGCKSVSIAHAHEEMSAQTVSRDKNNDLGLLKIEKPMASTAKLRGSPDLRVGDAAINYGYPLFGELSDSAKLNAGYVNSLAGYNNDSAVIQYSAPTQPGNSGGPVLDQSGNVIGVVSSGLSKRYAEESGHIAQNVNFAIKSTILEGFLKANNVPFEKANSTEKLELPDIAEKAEAFTVLVGCWE